MRVRGPSWPVGLWPSGLRRGEVLRDLGLWAGFVLLVAVENNSFEGDRAPWPPVIAGLLVLFGCVVLMRRRPVLGLGLAIALYVAQIATLPQDYGPFPVSGFLVLAVLSYLAGVRTPRARPVTVLFLASAGLVLPLAMLTFGYVLGFLNWLVSVLVALFGMVAPWLVGRYRRQQLALVQAGWERAERLEREQQIVVERERLREQARIARDMHDSVGHELSLVALRAGALELDPSLGESQRRSAGELRRAAGTATERLGEVIGMLRAGAEGGAVPGSADGFEAAGPLAPAGESIADLVERVRSSGMDVRLAQDEAGSAAPPLAAQAVHRVVREALTNAAKHAPGAAVTVRVTREGAETVVGIVNTAPLGPGPREAVPGSGFGLVGLRERVRLAGGTLVAEPRDGGFAVHARVPDLAPPRPPGLPEEEAPPADGETESARRLRDARRRVRNGLLVAVAVPTGLAAALTAIGLGYYVLNSYLSVLTPAAYSELRVGAPQEAVEDVLPVVEIVDPPDRRGTFPPGATCRHYRAEASPFALDTVYRVCFADGRLVAKYVIPTGSVETTETPRTESGETE